MEDFIGLLQGVLDAGPTPVPAGLGEHLANLLRVQARVQGVADVFLKLPQVAAAHERHQNGGCGLMVGIVPDVGYPGVEDLPPAVFPVPPLAGPVPAVDVLRPGEGQVLPFQGEPDLLACGQDLFIVEVAGYVVEPGGQRFSDSFEIPVVGGGIVRGRNNGAFPSCTVP